MVVCYEGPVDFGLGRLYELLERPEEALGCYRSALTGAVGLGARPAEAQLRLALGRLMGRRGFRSEAKRELEAGTDLASELGMQTTV